ncbi:MAG TPA: hypothetical protein VFH75_06615 [Actinomycetota bacterium]|nr:hypothetical protein [Actinomycetota bacterium]
MFFWRYFNVDGSEVGESERFSDRAEAEEWMGTAWSDLLSSGVEETALIDEERDRTLYRMGLRAE